MKSHGGADAFSFRNAIQKAHAEVTEGVLERIAQRIAAVPASVVAPAPAVATDA